MDLPLCLHCGVGHTLGYWKIDLARRCPLVLRRIVRRHQYFVAQRLHSHHLQVGPGGRGQAHCAPVLHQWHSTVRNLGFSHLPLARYRGLLHIPTMLSFLGTIDHAFHRDKFIGLVHWGNDSFVLRLLLHRQSMLVTLLGCLPANVHHSLDARRL